MQNYPVITSDKELMDAILKIWNDGNYYSWYDSFGPRAFNVKMRLREWQIKNRCFMIMENLGLG